MRLRVIKDDKECAKQLKRYFVLLLKADRIQGMLERFVHLPISKNSILKWVLLRKYYKLCILGRQLYLIKNNINYYITCVNARQLPSKLSAFHLQPLEEICVG